MREYIELTKPRITWLILMSTGIGYFFGLRGAANWLEFLRHIQLLPLLHTMLGTGLLASGTAALNQWYEREADRHMRRTALRPLPSGKMTPAHALAFGAALFGPETGSHVVDLLERQRSRCGRRRNWRRWFRKSC